MLFDTRKHTILPLVILLHTVAVNRKRGVETKTTDTIKTSMVNIACATDPIPIRIMMMTMK